MKQKVRTLLQKISYIETDMDLQKQILRSIPTKDLDQAEAVLIKIAAMKQQVLDLRQAIKETDPEEYDRIIALEQATEQFKALARQKRFVTVKTPDHTGTCAVTLNDGTCLNCLVAARDEAGTWTLMTLEGQIKEYPGGLVQG